MSKETREEIIIEFDISASTIGLDGEQMDELRVFLIKALNSQKQEILEKIDDWEYGFANYMTQMATKKSLDRGTMAKELAEEIKKLLK